VQAVCLFLCGLCDTRALMDAIVVRALTWAGAKELGTISRGFGALGWAVACPFFGTIYNRVGLAVLFRLYAPFVLLSVPVICSLPISRAYAMPLADADAEVGLAAEAGTQSRRSSQCGQGLRRTLAVVKPWRVRALLALNVGVGAQFGVMFTHQFVYLEHRLHATGVQLGLTSAAQAIIEVPLFFVVERLARKLGGSLRSMLTCMAAIALRLLMHVVTPSLWLLLPFEVAHGWSFAFGFQAGSQLAEQYAAEGLQATVMGTWGTSLQLGWLLATLLSSVLTDAFGERTMIAIFATLFAAAAAPLLPLACGTAVRRCTARGDGGERVTRSTREEASGSSAAFELGPCSPESATGTPVGSTSS
jgi:hypothetical protein